MIVKNLIKFTKLLVITSMLFLAVPEVAKANDAESAIAPVPRTRAYPWMSISKWFELHSEDVAIAEAGEAKLLFWGNSITQGWSWTQVWAEQFAPLGAANFGIGGDTTQNLLWRLDNGSVSALNPEKIVLLIGTNNFGLSHHDPQEVSDGVTAVVDKLLTVYPEADILLMAIFPRDENAEHPTRAKIRTVNQSLQPLGDLERVTYLDIGEQFLLPDGTLSQELMPDFLHLSEAGYEIWAGAVLQWLDSFAD
ncbi:MAG: hypothetical protein F6J87_19760 [Spirulina sp. SIO3F2]|nr:hypothetical protein [Spirulina sp. SIO3F2]